MPNEQSDFEKIVAGLFPNVTVPAGSAHEWIVFNDRREIRLVRTREAKEASMVIVIDRKQQRFSFGLGGRLVTREAGALDPEAGRIWAFLFACAAARVDRVLAGLA